MSENNIKFIWKDGFIDDRPIGEPLPPVYSRFAFDRGADLYAMYSSLEFFFAELKEDAVKAQQKLVKFRLMEHLDGSKEYIQD